MKVLHFYKTYYPDSYGGVQQVIYQIAQGTVALGVRSEVLFLSASETRHNQKLDDHIIHSSPLNLEIASTGFSLEAIARFKKLSATADIVHYHFPWPFMDLVHFLANVKKPTVVSYHSDIVKQKILLKLYRPLMHRFLAQADAIVASSPAYLENSEALRNHPEKTYVIPYGLDDNACLKPDLNTLNHWRRKLPERFFLFLGALRYYKGLNYLLEAAAINKLPVVIAGSGGVELELHQQARELSLDNVNFLGTVNEMDKAALLSLCTAFVFPSHLPSEAFGVSLLEAAMYAKPMISCEIGTGTTFINIDQQTGLSIPPANAPALAQAMERLWNNAALCTHYGQLARARFDQHFTAQAMAHSYASLYNTLLSSPLQKDKLSATTG